MTIGKKPDLDQLIPYVDAGYTLIPLHKWNKTSSHKGKTRQDGKRPIHKNWTKPLHDNSREAISKAKDGHNAGVKLSAQQLVIDVDPRNMDDDQDAFKDLCEAIGLNPEDYPRVDTGSGGLHLYMTKDENVSVVDTVEGYNGVEFKTLGRQVVAAGSVHPNGKRYEFDFLGVALEDALPAPDRLMSLIRRPVRTNTGSKEGGEYKPIEIAAMLDELNPEDFGGQEMLHGTDWLTLMMACHHASDGDARDEFIEWCSRDPAYADDSWMVGRRWDSLHKIAPGNTTPVTSKTLEMVLQKSGKQEVIPRAPAKDDTAFADDPEFDEEQEHIPDHERKGPLAMMNDTYWAVDMNGKFKLMYDLYDPGVKRNRWIISSVSDFNLKLANKQIDKQNAKGELVPTPIAEEWIKWPKRRSAAGVVFDPERNHKGWLNLWTGWGVEPIQGEWGYTQELIHEVLAGGDEQASEFILNWLAYMVQHPGTLPEVAICFRGDKGTGKSTLGQALCTLAGRHGLHVTSPSHVTGNFNNHLRDCIFLFADEAIQPHDKPAQAALKSLITDKMKTYEAKGVDLVSGNNMVHIMSASNDDAFVDAGINHERRYFVQEVSNVRRQDTAFFGSVHKELYGAGRRGKPGLSAMLHDLLLRDISGWAPRGNIPTTNALIEQKIRNLDHMGKWWFEILDRAETPFDSPLDEQMEDADWWRDQKLKVFKQDVLESYATFCIKSGFKSTSQGNGQQRFFWKAFKQYVPELSDRQIKLRIPDERHDVSASGNDGRAIGLEIPCLELCREHFARQLGGNPVWETK